MTPKRQYKVMLKNNGSYVCCHAVAEGEKPFRHVTEMEYMYVKRKLNVSYVFSLRSLSLCQFNLRRGS